MDQITTRYISSKCNFGNAFIRRKEEIDEMATEENLWKLELMNVRGCTILKNGIINSAFQWNALRVRDRACSDKTGPKRVRIIYEPVVSEVTQCKETPSGQTKTL